ncbi:MAG: helix-turn-helix domain-containing protein [Bacilli bacterium]
MEIIKKIKYTRQKLKITQETMGLRLGVSRETYRNIENGRINLKLSDYLKICHILELSPSYFLSHHDDEYMLVPKKQMKDIFTLLSQLTKLRDEVNDDDLNMAEDPFLYMADSGINRDKK